MITERDKTRLEGIDDDIENEQTNEYTQADMIWLRCLLEEVIKERDDALHRIETLLKLNPRP